MSANKTDPIFVFEIPENKNDWGPTLITSLTNALDNLSQKIENLKPSIVNELKAEFSGEIQAVKKIASDALDLALSNEEKIRSMKDDLLDLRIVCSRVTEENGRLRLQCDRQESYTRKDNLIIRGLTR